MTMPSHMCSLLLPARWPLSQVCWPQQTSDVVLSPADDSSREASAQDVGEEANSLCSSLAVCSRTSDTPTAQDEPSPACGVVTAELVFREHAGRVFRLARRMLGNDADAEDVAQDVLLQVVRKLDTFRGEAALTTWLHRVTANAALALRRRRAARRERSLAAIPESSLEAGHAAAGPRRRRPAPDEQALGCELRQVIEAAVGRLPRLYRETYVLADVEGLSNAAVGVRLGLSLPAVKSRLHRARLMMRDALAPFFEEQPS